MKHKILFIALVGMTLVPSLTAFAASPFVPNLKGPLITCAGSAQSAAAAGLPVCQSFCDIVATARNLIQFGMSLVVVILGPLFILWGAILILTSGPNPSRMQQGKKSIFAAVIGILIALIAYIIVSTFLWLVGNPAPGSGKPRVAWPNVVCSVQANPPPVAPPTGGPPGGGGPPPTGGPPPYCTPSCPGDPTCPECANPSPPGYCTPSCPGDPGCPECSGGPPPSGGGTCTCDGAFTGPLATQTLCNMVRTNYGLNCTWQILNGVGTCYCSGPVPCVKDQTSCSQQGVISSCGVSVPTGVTFNAACTWSTFGT